MSNGSVVKTLLLSGLSLVVLAGCQMTGGLDRSARVWPQELEGSIGYESSDRSPTHLAARP